MVKKSSEDQTDDLTMAGFSLLSLVLSQWFRPATSDPVDEACRQARLELLERTSQYCDLCTLLLRAYDGSLLRGGGHKEKSLAGHTLAVLLACSDTAKKTALKGYCASVCAYMHPCVHLVCICSCGNVSVRVFGNTWSP